MNEYKPLVIEDDIYTASSHDELTHWHNCFEIIEVLDGSFQCHVDGDSFVVKKGNLCIINRGHMHRILNEKDPQQCRKKALIFNPDFFIKDKDIYTRYIRPLLQDRAFSHIQFAINSGIGLDLFSFIKQLEVLYKERPVGFEMESYGLIYMIIRRLYLAYAMHQDHFQSSFDENIQIQRKMTTYIYKQYANKIALDDIADAGQISRSTCIRLFKKYTGKSPVDFLNSYRLERSIELLLTTNQQVTEISYACGFNQPSYFNRLFLKEYQMTPNQYRKENKH